MFTLKDLFKKKDKDLDKFISEFNKLEKKPIPLEIDLPIKGNYQLDNINFISIPASSQCGYTSLAVLLGQFIEEANNDKFIKEMIETFEKDFLSGKSSRYGSSMKNHTEMAKFYLEKYNVDRQVIFKENSGTVQDVIEVLKKGYAIGVAGMMTNSGHFMVISGYSEVRKAFKVQDPYKLYDFEKKRYTNQSGLNAYYPIDKFYPYLNQSSLVSSNGKKNGIRFYYIGDKKS